MTNDLVFRVILLCLGGTLLPIGLVFRLRSNVREPLDRWQEGVAMLFGLRLAAAVTLVAAVAYLMKPASMAWASLPLPTWSRWIGVALAVAAWALYPWTFLHLGRNLTDTVVTRGEHALVTSGPYRWVRHPFYLAFAVGVVGTGLVSANAFLFAAGGFVFFLLVLRTKTEEAHLVRRFGDAYREYMRCTGRFLPRFRPRGPSAS